MEEKATIWESLAGKAETYVKTNIEIARLKATDKVSDVASVLALRLVYVFLALLIILMLNFGLALYLNEWVGNSYGGFFIVAIFYLVLVLLVYVFRTSLVKQPVKDAVISSLLDENDEPQP